MQITNAFVYRKRSLGSNRKCGTRQSDGQNVRQSDCQTVRSSDKWADQATKGNRTTDNPQF